MYGDIYPRIKKFHKCYWHELSVHVPCFLLKFSSADIGIVFFLNSPEHTNVVSQEHVLFFFFPTKHSIVWPCDPSSSQYESLQYPYYHNNITFFIRLIYLPLVGSLGALSRWRRVGFYAIPDSHCVLLPALRFHCYWSWLQHCHMVLLVMRTHIS